MAALGRFCRVLFTRCSTVLRLALLSDDCRCIITAVCSASFRSLRFSNGCCQLTLAIPVAANRSNASQCQHESCQGLRSYDAYMLNQWHVYARIQYVVTRHQSNDGYHLVLWPSFVPRVINRYRMTSSGTVTPNNSIILTYFANNLHISPMK